MTLHRACAKKKILKKEYQQKKTKSGKNPIKVERKKTQPNREKKNCMARYHTEKQQKNPKTAKNTKLAECQALAQIRLFKKDVKTTRAITGERGHQIHQNKLFLVHNSTKNLDAWSKSGGKILRRDTSQLSQKTSYWRGNQGCWSLTVQKELEKKIIADVLLRTNITS